MNTTTLIRKKNNTFIDKVLRLEFPLVGLAAGAAAFAGSQQIAWLAGAVLLAGLFWPLRRAATGRWSVRTPLDWPLAWLLLLIPVTLWASAVPEKTLPQVLRLLTGAALFYALVNWRRMGGENLRLAADGLLAVGLLLALAAPFMVQWNTLKLAFIPPGLYAPFRLLATDPANPNVMAGSLVLLLPVGAGLLLYAWREMKAWERLLAAGFVLLGGGMLALTQSRGAWLALLVALAILVWLRFRWGWALVLGGGVAGLGLAAWAGPARLANALVSSATLGGLQGRLEVWSRAVYMLQDFPFTGIGMGAFTETADRLYPFFSYAPGTVEHAHNLFLQVGVDLGLPGLIAWLAILFGCLAAAWRASRGARRASQPWLEGLGAGLLGAQAALVVHGLTDAVTWGMVRPAPLVWLVFGLCVAAFLHGQNP